jgi:hypothetical protein
MKPYSIYYNGRRFIVYERMVEEWTRHAGVWTFVRCVKREGGAP